MHGPGTTVYYAKLLYVWMLVYDLPERLLVLLPAYALESRRGFCFKPLVPCILMAARLWSAHPWQFWPLLEWFFHFIDGRFFLSPFSLSFSLCKLCVEKNSRAIEKEEAVGKWQSSSALGSADPDCTQTHITWNERAKACAPPLISVLQDELWKQCQEIGIEKNQHKCRVQAVLWFMCTCLA